jgi:hypothetical protein
VRLGGYSTNAELNGKIGSVTLGRTTLPSNNDRYAIGRHAAWIVMAGLMF